MSAALSPETARHRRRMAFAGASLLLALLLLAAAWRWTPLHAYADPRLLADHLQDLQSQWWTPLLVMLVYVVANAMLFPNTILNVATILGLGTAMGVPCALLGSLAASVVFYAFGLRYGKEQLRKLESIKLERLARVLRDGGIVSVAMVRLVPVAPHTVVNIAAGAMHVRFWPFVIGTTLGLLPGNLLVGAFGAQLRAVLRHPTPFELVLLSSIALLALACVWWTSRRLSTFGHSLPH
ncbi:MAG TPA: VTT domain-containing protein [Nevskiaceae bacterium]|nr:VTT domain-containing protein [Nevskiaceae bacterium]